MAQVCETLPKRMLQDRGPLPKGEGDFVRCFKTTHEEHILTSWLRYVVGDTAEERH